MKNTRISVRVTKEEMKRLKDISFNFRMSLSALLTSIANGDLVLLDKTSLANIKSILGLKKP
jgi:hypothetical protein